MYGRDAYQHSAAQTASPAQLVLMLYDGALARIEQAEDALEGTPNVPVAHEAIVKAQRIISELDITLDRRAGGQIAANLAVLYDYINDRLVTANIQKDVTALADAANALRPLRDAWEEACVNTLEASVTHTAVAG